MGHDHEPNNVPHQGTAQPNGGQQPTDPAAVQLVLYPHRSLSLKGFRNLMIALGGVSLVTGVIFLLKGAWPVFGFFGLDILLVYVAFRLNYRAANLHERIDLNRQLLTITRVYPSGEQESREFNPYWVRVRLAQSPQGTTDLRLASHGQEFAFARFLTDDERRDLCHFLSGALAEARAARA
ncbi:DUF2244 domain-containing protein [Hyphomicrobium sulfonivorans]|uniref:DUF2244 domain-containing protein n=1 Tax=Hyphomicrobium sulfonivorans TaxID=121290 RepID=UPI0009FA3401|nr:DUF2244 domain-containing protein [Hyphomicrobium sulfonivorans]MBI1648566.1 DUF2244 domain-containing protein [Hyphomicrobium sulfonivorans]NSL70896.1 DUF2244 domain-containing protein [Hyphomicrobium sulfonivorans]